MPTDRRMCFVIMPFGKTTEEHNENYWTEHFEYLKSIIEENPKLEAHRSKALRGNILTEIISNLFYAPIVVADLTDLNANVFFELGIRQSLKHGTITIKDKKTKLPFDISGKGTLQYSDDHLKEAKFRKNFKDALSDCLSYPDRPDSLVLDTLSGRGTLFEIFQRDEALRRLQALNEECIWNDKALDQYIKLAKENKGKKITDCDYPNHRTRLNAVELLITNRYVDEDVDFYARLLNQYWSWFSTIDDLFKDWLKYPVGTGNWIIDNGAQAKEISAELIGHVGNLIEELR